MKKALFLIFCAGFLNTAIAGDSASYVCIGPATIFNRDVKITVNLFEHRNDSGDGRETDLVLIYGQYVLKGTYSDSESDEGVVVLKDSVNNFVGNYSMNWSEKKVTLNGKITLSREVSKLVAKLNCKSLD